MISENEYSGGCAPDSGNVFNVRSNDGGKTIEFDHFCFVEVFRRAGRSLRPTILILTRRQALLLAAWLVCIAGGDRRDFEDLLHAIRKP